MHLRRVSAGLLFLTLSCVTAQAAHHPGPGLAQPRAAHYPSHSASHAAVVTPAASPPAASSTILVTEPHAAPCHDTFLEPFEQELHWRAAYRGVRPGTYRYCPDWSHFGPVRPHGKLHRGFDLASPTGTPVRVAIGGKLSYARDATGWGLFARLRFRPSVRAASGACEQGEELELVYGHLVDDTPSLVMGAEKDVAAGATIGRVGCSGNARGMCSPSPESHLHVTLRTIKDHRQIDPAPMLGWTPHTPEAGGLEACQ